MYYLFLIGFIYADCSNYSPPAQTLGEMACSIEQSFPGIVQLMVAAAYVCGIGFALAALFKFKQVKDNPTQIPIGTPFALLMCSALLVFLPGLFQPLGITLFGTGSSPIYGSPTGTTIKGLTE